MVLLCVGLVTALSKQSFFMCVSSMGRSQCYQVTLSASREIYMLIHSRKTNMYNTIFKSKLCITKVIKTWQGFKAMYILADRQKFKLLLSCLSVFRATPAHWIMSNITTGLPRLPLGGEGIEIVRISVEGYPGTVCGNPDET